MTTARDVLKRAVLGRALESRATDGRLLPKKVALPVLASDPLSSVAYATQEILLFLAVGGLAYLYLAPYVAAAVVLLLVVVVASYRQLVHAYPTGGGDYEVAHRNLGPAAGKTVASALLVDYVLTVAVSVSAGVDNIISAFGSLADQRVALAVGLVALLTALNLRGVRESGRLVAVPTYAFVAAVALMVGTGLLRVALGDPPVAESARYDVVAQAEPVGALAFAFFVLRAFSSGCTALTGVESIATGVPAFKKPKSRNAATTLLLMGALSAAMFLGVTGLALVADVHYVERVEDLVGYEGEVQRSVIAQLAAAVFGDGSVLFFAVLAATAAILILAANTAYTGFPLLGSILAQDRYLPRQLHTRGDRLVYSNGIVLLAVFASLLIYAFDASVNRLIQLYIIGVFTSFTFGQVGMVVHWNRELATGALSPADRAQVLRSRAINATGATLTGTVLVIVTVTKFTAGAWIVLIAMPVLYAGMRAIRSHYDAVSDELALADGTEQVALPSRNHAVVLVSKVHSPTLRALAYAKATRPSTLVALTVDISPEDTRRLQDEWDRQNLDIPLVTVASPYREITRPVLDYVARIRRDSPRDVVTVFIPEYVVGHWYEQLLHNQSALRLKGRLLFQPGVMVTSVPYQLRSSERVDRDEPRGPGSARRPVPTWREAPPPPTTPAQDRLRRDGYLR